MSVTAGQVKELREATGVGMMECKKALVENQGNFDKAIVWLREKDMARAANKAGRTTAEGIVGYAIANDGKTAVMLEINCETDFAGKNKDFQEFVQSTVKAALDAHCKDLEQLKSTSLGNGQTVATGLSALISKVGENMTLRRMATLSVDEGIIVGYSHMGGKIGSLVALKGTGEKFKIDLLGADLAMHVAAAAPRFLNSAMVSPEEVEQEKAIAATKLAELGKSGEILEMAMAGQVMKFYADVCLVNQPFVKEPKLSVEKYIKQSGLPVEVVGFQRFQLGEGIEVKVQNFADEVAAQLKS